MSFKYSATFLALAVGLVAAALPAWHAAPIVGVLLGYAAFSFLLVSLAYAGLGPRVFLKRRDGRLGALAVLTLGPFLALNALAFWLYRRGDRQRAYALAAPNLYFGRRLTSKEARRTETLGWRSVLDLAGEFSEAPALRRVERYRSLPLLDATAPTEEQLRDAVAWINESLQHGPAYVHCALGHGRTGSVVIAWLVSQGLAATVDEALERLRALRSGVGLHPAQRERVQQFAQSLLRPRRNDETAG